MTRKYCTQVRDAGEEAWLGKEAPEDPALDVPEDEPLLMLPPAPEASAKAAQKGASAQQPDPNSHLSFGVRLHGLPVQSLVSTVQGLSRPAIKTVRGGQPRSLDRLPVSYKLACISRDALRSSVSCAQLHGCFGLGSVAMVCAAKRGTSFRSVHAAMAAARDGDHIILRKGIHNGLG